MKNIVSTLLLLATTSTFSCGKYTEKAQESSHQAQNTLLAPSAYHLTIPAHKLHEYEQNPTGYGQHGTSNQEGENNHEQNFPDTTTIEIGGHLYLLLSKSEKNN